MGGNGAASDSKGRRSTVFSNIKGPLDDRIEREAVDALLSAAAARAVELGHKGYVK